MNCQLNMPNFDPAQFIVANCKINQAKPVKLQRMLDNLEMQVSKDSNLMKQSIKVDKSDEQRKQTEILIKASRFAKKIEENYLEFQHESNKVSDNIVLPLPLEEQKGEQSLEEDQLLRMQQQFMFLLKEEQYLEATSLLSLIHTQILQNDRAESQLSIFTESRSALKQQILGKIDYKYDVYLNSITINVVNSPMLEDQHLLLCKELQHIQGDKISRFDCFVYIAEQLNFLEDIYQQLTLERPSFEFYVTNQTAEQFVNKLFGQFKRILQNLQKIQRSLQNCHLQVKEHYKVRVIIRNFKLLRTYIKELIQKHSEQEKLERCKLFDFAPFNSIYTLISQNLVYFKAKNCFLAVDDEELNTLLIGVEQTIIEQSFDYAQQFPFNFQLCLHLSPKYEVLDGAFGKSKSCKITNLQNVVLLNVESLIKTLAIVKIYQVESVTEFMKRVLSIQLQGQREPLEQLVEATYYYAVQLKFVVPECFELLKQSCNDYFQEAIDSATQQIGQLIEQQFDLQLAQAVSRANHLEGSKEEKLIRMRAYANSRKYDFYTEEMLQYLRMFLL